jgi:hypothetical protein
MFLRGFGLPLRGSAAASSVIVRTLSLLLDWSFQAQTPSRKNYVSRRIYTLGGMGQK